MRLCLYSPWSWCPGGYHTYMWTRAHAFKSFTLMKLILVWWLCLLSVCCSTCSAAPQKEVQFDRKKAHNICDLLRSSNIRWISVTLWLVWWVPAVPSDLYIQYSDPPRTSTHTEAHTCRHTHMLQCLYEHTHTHAHTHDMHTLFKPLHASPRPHVSPFH